MSLNLFVTDAATEDALRIAEYLAEHSGLSLSDTFLSATTQAYRQLAEMPGMGVSRSYRNPRLEGMKMVRLSGFPNYLVFYQAMDADLTILRVLHGSQNIRSLFSPEEEN